MNLNSLGISGNHPDYNSPKGKKADDSEEAGGFAERTLHKVRDFFEDKVVGTWKEADYRAKGSVVGAGVGAAVGYIAGLQEEAHNVVVQKTYPVPMTQDRNLGNIPTDWYQNDAGHGDPGPIKHSPDYAPKGQTEIHRSAPILDPRGNPLMTDKTETLQSLKFNSAVTTLLGVTIGAAAGFLAAIALRLVNDLRNS